MAAVFGRTEIGIRKTGQTTTIPESPKAKLMYYFNCVCSCVDTDNDSTIRRLRDYKNYWSLTNEEEAQLLILCLALSPDKLIGTLFFPAEDLEGCNNEFFELSAVNTKLVVAESLLIGGQQKRVHTIMMFKKNWIEKFYIQPLQAYQRGSRPALPSSRPPAATRQRSNNSSCTIL